MRITSFIDAILFEEGDKAHPFGEGTYTVEE
jgi:hypothetical protein